MKRISLLILLIPFLCFAQQFNFVFEPDSIPVTIDSWEPYCPWAGGMSRSNLSIVDIDNDGDLDYLVGEYFGYIRYFRNDGNVSEPDFTFVTAQFDSIYLDEAVANQCFRDLDNDGDLDLVVSDNDPHVHYFENISSPQIPHFEHVTENLVPYQSPWCRGPELADIDGDSDYDLFGGNYGYISFFRNEGTPDSFDFVLETGTFSGIDVVDRASPEFVDIDSDDDLDIFVGNEYGRIWYYRNDGDSLNYDFIYVTDYYDSIDVVSYASPEFANIDGDGDFDLFVGREYDYPSSLVGDVFYYENTGTPIIPQFELITKNYLTLDLGIFAKSQLVDINGDNLMDLIVGTSIELTYFENIGNPLSPSFILAEEGFQGISISAIKPCFVDLDADGDYDLLCGEGVIPGPPSIALYINQGTPRNPQLILENSNFITNPDFWVNANPGCADIDADGDYDLFVTDDHGHFFFYRNDGSTSWPNFTLVDSFWQGIQYTYPNCGWRGFCFADLDEDGDLDLLMRNYYVDNLRFYRNVGSPQTANMYLEEEDFFPEYFIYHAYPYAVDIDSDDDLDLFVGDGDGGIMFFRNHGSSLVSPHNQIQPYSFTLHQNYPNPFNASTTIPFTLDRKLPVKVVVYDILGREVQVLGAGDWGLGKHQVVWDAGGLASGVYLISLEAGSNFSQARKVMLVK